MVGANEHKQLREFDRFVFCKSCLLSCAFV